MININIVFLYTSREYKNPCYKDNIIKYCPILLLIILEKYHEFY